MLEPEQSFTTAPGSLSLSANPAGVGTPSINASAYEQGHVQDTPGDTSPLKQRDIPPHMADATNEMAQAEDRWAQALNALDRLYAQADNRKSELNELRREFIRANERATEMANDIRAKLIRSDERAIMDTDGLQELRTLIENTRTELGGKHTPSLSPRARATQAIYAE